MLYTDVSLFCPRCNLDVVVIVTQSGVHQKAVCDLCGKYIKFLSKEERERFQASEDAYIEHEKMLETYCAAPPPKHTPECPNNTEDWDPAQDDAFEPIPF